MKYRIAVVLAAATFLQPLAVEAYEVKRSAEGALVRWREPQVVWRVGPSMQDVVEGNPAFAQALAAWSGRQGAPVLDAEPSRTDVAPGYDGVNAVVLAREGAGPVGAALAVTVLSFDERTGAILDADIVVNGRYRLARDAAAAGQVGEGADHYDVQRVLAHEIGHALGLSDEPAHDDALMFPFVPPNVAVAAIPGDDDLAGVRRLYEGDDDSSFAGCSSATIARTRDLRAGGAVSLALGAVALVLGACARRTKRAGGTRGTALVFAAASFVVPPSRIVPPSLRSDVAATRGARIDPVLPRASGDLVAMTVASVSTKVDASGLFVSTLGLAEPSCLPPACAPSARASTWGGSLGGVRQELGGMVVPSIGDRVEVEAPRRGPSTLVGGPGLVSSRSRAILGGQELREARLVRRVARGDEP